MPKVNVIVYNLSVVSYTIKSEPALKNTVVKPNSYIFETVNSSSMKIEISETSTPEDVFKTLEFEFSADSTVIIVIESIEETTEVKARIFNKLITNEQFDPKTMKEISDTNKPPQNLTKWFVFILGLIIFGFVVFSLIQNYLKNKEQKKINP
jgi:hypothetical protein